MITKICRIYISTFNQDGAFSITWTHQQYFWHHFLILQADFCGFQEPHVVMKIGHFMTLKFFQKADRRF